MREDTKVILVLTIATLLISASSILILMEFGPVGRVVETSNATFVIETTTTSVATTTTVAGGSTVSPSGGGRTEEVIVDFDIIISEPLSGNVGDTLVTKILLRNGNRILKDISLSAIANRPGLAFFFSPSIVAELKADEEIEIDLIISTSGQAGTYLINIEAVVKSPSISSILNIPNINRFKSGKTNCIICIIHIIHTYYPSRISFISVIS